MEFTRRATGYTALAGGVAILSVILASPLLLVGAAGLGAWVLGRQWQFVRAVTQAERGLTVEQRPAREHVTVDDDTTVFLSGARADPSPVSITVEAGPPVATTGGATEERTVDLGPDTESAETAFSVAAPTAGQHTFRPATVTLTDEDGLFRTRFRTGTQPTLTVEPREPDNIHVGEGGEQYGAFGAFQTGEYGEGITPAELRQYVPGDPADRIDWNATARLGSPHVLEFEVETDRRSMLVMDHRSSLGTGPDGERKFDYLRQVALAFLAAARTQNQSVGLLAVGDDGVTTRFQPATGEDHYARLTRALFALDVTDTGTPASPTPAGTLLHPRSPADATQAASTLDDDSTFAHTLRPFFADADPYLHRIEERPLYETVRTEVAQVQGPVVTLLLTDDDRRGEVRETVAAGTRGDNRVAAFIAPSVLYEDGAFADLPTAYDRYVSFESVRKELAGNARVEASEVAPEARIEALLSARRRGEFA